MDAVETSSSTRSTTSFASAQDHYGHHGQIDRAEEGLAPMNDTEKLTPVPSVSPRPPSEENELFKPKSFKFWLTLICNFLALFLVALDRTIIATAVPRITDEFHSLGDIGWYGSSYMLTTSSAQLVYGRIYKFYDMKWVFLLSVIIFEGGSAICGAAPNSIVFIVGRAIAGLGSAGIFSGCMLIMIPMIPLHKRPMFQGMFGMVFGIASVMGPLIGGGFTNGASWRWCFYLNLPIGAVTFFFMVFFWNPPNRVYEPGTTLEHIKRLDPLGMFFFVPSVVCLLLALQWGGATYEWASWRIILLFALFAVGLVAFIAVQILKPDTATVPPRVITQRSVAFGTAFTFFLSGSMLMLVYYVPIWFQTVQLVNPLKSGIYTLPLVLSLVASSIISGIFTQKIGYYVPSMILAPSLMSVGEGLMSTWSQSTPEPRWIGYQFLAGFGLGFGMQTSGLAVQTVLPPPDISTGIAVNFFVQQLGGAVFTSVGQSILTNLLASRLSGIAGLNAATLVQQGVTDLTATVPAEYLDLVIDAYNYACQRIFLASMGLAFAALLSALGMEWRSIKKGRHRPPGAATGGPPPPGARGAVAGGPIGPAGPGVPGMAAPTLARHLSTRSKVSNKLVKKNTRDSAHFGRSKSNVSEGVRPSSMDKSGWRKSSVSEGVMRPTSMEKNGSRKSNVSEGARSSMEKRTSRRRRRSSAADGENAVVEGEREPSSSPRQRRRLSKPPPPETEAARMSIGSSGVGWRTEGAEDVPELPTRPTS